jgi:hypothetical protein
MFFYSLCTQAQGVTLQSSNLPIVIISTGGANIIAGTKIMADMKVIYNGPGKRNYVTNTVYHYKGKIGIEIRGNVTATWPKKPYSIETRFENGENREVALCGMPPESDWNLMANHLDKTLMRNSVASYMAQRMGNWASRWSYCEVIVNGSYNGVYALVERIKINKNRVDIEELTPVDNDAATITGGYIWEISPNGDDTEDFGSDRKLVAPKSIRISPQQKQYIRSYDDQFRSAMSNAVWDNLETGYPKWIDTQSFIDEIILQEACKNSDAYGWSGYFHKNRMQKICAGPIWDFDQSLCNSAYNDGSNAYEWLLTKTGTGTPFFWPKLFTDPTFKYLLKKRWFELRASALNTDTILQFINSNVAILNEAQVRNFIRWPILGTPEPWPWRALPGYETRNTYQKEVDSMKAFVVRRFNWMDEQLAAVPNVTITSPLLAITEFFYLPLSGANFEYVKITNRGSATVSVSNVSLTEGIFYTFPVNSTLKAGESLILAADSERFRKKFGYKPFGQFSGHLGDDSGKLCLRDCFGQIIDTFTYRNGKSGWPKISWTEPGALQLKNINLNNAVGANWTRITVPKDLIPISDSNDTVIDVNTGIKDGASEQSIVYPNPASDFVALKNIRMEKSLLEIIDLNGRTCIRLNMLPQEEVSINTSRLPGGKYLVRFITDKELRILPLLIIH